MKNNHLYLYLVLKLPYYPQYSLVTWHECQLSFGCPRRLSRRRRRRRRRRCLSTEQIIDPRSDDTKRRRRDLYRDCTRENTSMQCNC